MRDLIRNSIWATGKQNQQLTFEKQIPIPDLNMFSFIWISQCETINEQKCDTKYDTIYEEKCETVYDTVYDTTYDEKCETEYVTEYDQKCETKYDTEYDTQVRIKVKLQDLIIWFSWKFQYFLLKYRNLEKTVL